MGAEAPVGATRGLSPLSGGRSDTGAVLLQVWQSACVQSARAACRLVHRNVQQAERLRAVVRVQFALLLVATAVVLAVWCQAGCG